MELGTDPPRNFRSRAEPEVFALPKEQWKTSPGEEGYIIKHHETEMSSETWD